MLSLSICIVSKNRPKNLKKTVKNFLRLIKNKDMEIIVVDGSYAANSYLQKVSDVNSNMIYFHDPNDENLDKAYDISVRKASKKYCLMSTDDDAHNPKIIEILEKKMTSEYDLIIMNTSVMCSDLKYTLQKNRLKIFKDFELISKQPRKFEQNIIDQLSYIGSLVVKREIWTSIDGSKFWGTYFGYITNIFNHNRELKIFVISDILVNLRIDVESWKSHHLLIWHFYWPRYIKMIFNKFHGFQEPLIEDISIKQLIKYRALKLLDESLDMNIFSDKLKIKLESLKKVPIIICQLIIIVHSIIKNNKILKYRVLKKL